MAVLDHVGGLIERVSYDPYGRGRHHWPGDVDGDGDQDTSDSNVIATLAGGGGTAITSSSYNVDCDLNRDGMIDSTDQSMFGSTQTALSRGSLSSSSVGNVIGYCGYVYNAEVSATAAGLYTVRFRHYDPGLGRWISRDPLRYVDGMNVYEYVVSSPVYLVDPLGLEFYWSWRGFFSGFGDGAVLALNNVSLGFLFPTMADNIRSEEGHSSWYSTGDWVSWGGGAVLPGLGLGKLFKWGGRLSKGVVNKNPYARVGWSRVKSGPRSGQPVFRIAFGGGESSYHLMNLTRPWNSVVGWGIWIGLHLWARLDHESSPPTVPTPPPLPDIMPAGSITLPATHPYHP